MIESTNQCANKMYDETFYNQQYKGSFDSAKKIIPILFEYINPKSVIDFGCGLGCWLSVFKDFQVENIVGLDGEYVSQDQLFIPQEKFISHDLNVDFKIQQKFDLAISLEVAEHLPEERAEGFVRNLTKASDVIMFSAAVPYQDGVNHINEQWQDYWVNLFEQNGFVPVDVIRSRVWSDKAVEFWYSQNILVFVNSKVLKNYKKLSDKYEKAKDQKQYSIVHPQLHEIKNQRHKTELSNYKMQLKLCQLKDNEKLVQNVNSHSQSVCNKKICFWGAGEVARKIFSFVDLKKFNVMGVIDSDTSKINHKIGDYDIFLPEELKILNPELVIVSAINFDAILPSIVKIKEQYNLKFQIMDDFFFDV